MTQPNPANRPRPNTNPQHHLSKRPSSRAIITTLLQRDPRARILPIHAVVRDRARRAICVFEPDGPGVRVLILTIAQPEGQERVQELGLASLRRSPARKVRQGPGRDVAAVRDCIGQVALGGDIDYSTG